MVDILQGDLIYHEKSNKEYIVDSIEFVDGCGVVFTDQKHCKCFPLSDVYKIPKSKLAYFFLKKMNGTELSQQEEEYVDEKFKELKLVTIKPFNPNDFELPNLISGTTSQTSVPFFTRFCQWIGLPSFQRIRISPFRNVTTTSTR